MLHLFLISALYNARDQQNDIIKYWNLKFILRFSALILVLCIVYFNTDFKWCFKKFNFRNN